MTDTINIKLLLQGQESWKQFRERINEARADTNALKKDMKALVDLSKAFETKKIFGTPGGFNRAVLGTEFQSNMRAQRTMDFGLGGMQQMTQAKETLRLTNELVKTYDRMGGVIASANVKLGTTEEELRKINSLAEAKNRLSGTEIQLANALKNGDTARVADLARQRDVIKEQVDLLTRQAQEAAKSPLTKTLEQTGLTNRAIRAQAGSAREAMASSLNISTITEEIKKISTLEDARAMKHAIIARSAQEELSGNKAISAEFTRQLQILAEQEKHLRIRDQRSHTLERLGGDGGASLMAVQGMVTANAMALGGVKNIVTGGMQFAADFDNELRNIQAITVTTDENMGKLKQTIIEVSQSTKFMATDVAGAALILGQAGLSTKDISDTLGSIAKLASATGTDMAQSVDVATSVIGVFNLDATQMGHVADTLTTAVNKTKLNIDKLALGLQYVGNTAADSNVSFEEVTATLGAMSNAGIRSGSTLGTGMRQILIALEKPSKEFKENLDRLGISMADIDLRTNGLYGALKNLKEGGFTASDAMRSFEVRAAAAYNAVAGNLDSIVDLERSFMNQGAAAQASDTQMRSLTNTWNRFKSNIQVVISEGFQPLMLALRDTLGFLADLAADASKHTTALKLLTTVVGSLAAAFVTVKTITLVTELAQLGTAALTAAKTLPIVATALEGVGFSAAAAGTGFSALLGPIGLIATALVGVAWYSYTSEVNRAAQAMETAQTAFDNAQGALEATKTKIETVDEKMRELSEKSDMLAKNQNVLQLEADKVRQQFESMGIVVTDNVTKVGDLTGALRTLREQLQKDYVLDIQTTERSLKNLIEANKAQVNSIAQENFGSGWLNRMRDRDIKRADPESYSLIERARSSATNSAAENRSLAADIADRIISLRNQGVQEPGLGNILSGGIDERSSVLTSLIKAGGALDQIAKLQSDQISLTNQLADQNRARVNAENLQKNAPIANQVQDFTNSARSRVLGAASNASQDDAMGQFNAAVAETKRVESEAARIKEELNKNTSLTDDVRKQLLQSVENAMASAQDEQNKLADAALTVAKNNAKMAKTLNEAKDKNLSASMGRATSEDAVYDMAGRRAALAQNTFDTAKAQLLVDNNNDTTSTGYISGIEDLKADQEAKLAAIRADIVERVKTITGAGVSDLDRTINAIEAQIRATNEKDYDKRENLFGQLTAALKEKNTKQIEQAMKTISDPIELDQQKKALASELDQAIADVGMRVKADAEQKAQDFVGIAQSLAATAEAGFKAALDKATSTDQVKSMMQSRLDTSETMANAQRVGLANQLQEGKITDGEYSAGLTSIIQQQQARNEQIKKDASDKIGQLMKLQSDGTENAIREIELKLRQTGDLAFEEKKKLFSELEAATTAKYDQEEAAINADLTSTVAEKQAALEALHTSEMEAMQVIVEQKTANDVAAAQAAIAQTDDALQKVEAMAENLTDKVKLVALMKQAMALIAKRAGQVNALADADPNDAITRENAQSDGAKFDAEHRRKWQQYEFNINKYGNTGGRIYGSGGGGGGGGKGKSPEELMVDQMQDRVKTVETLLKAKLLDGATGVTQIDQIVADTKTKVADLDAKIAAMQSKVNGGQMSKEDLEHLNDLLKAREELTKNAAAAEMLLTEEMAKQGNYWEATKHFTTNWAKENLDIGKTFTQGLGNVLSSLTSGFATLFTELADGSVSAGQAFRNFAVMAIKSMMQMIAQMLAVYAMQKLIGMVFPGAQAPGSFGAVARSSVGLMMGGAVRKADGGQISGHLARDSKLHSLMPGEYVLRKSAVDMIGVDKLDQLNAMGNRKMAAGGHAGVASQRQGSIGMTNVYVVSPEQKPVPGPNDIIAIINDDIARGGPTKRLIKTVSMGF